MQSMHQLQIEFIEGTTGPKYVEVKQIELTKAVIIEQGMLSGLPFVDLILTDTEGKKYLAVTTGRMINALSSAIKGANLRNHGVEEP